MLLHNDVLTKLRNIQYYTMSTALFNLHINVEQFNATATVGGKTELHGALGAQLASRMGTYRA